MNLRDVLLADEFKTNFAADSVEARNEEILEFHIAQEAFNDMMIETREIERLHDVAVGLENLNKVCGFVKNATSIELAFVETATSLALAGTDINYEQIFPSIENYKDGKIATEKLGKFARNLWKSIVKMTKRVAVNVTRFYNSITKSIPKLKKSAEDLKLRADGVKEKSLISGEVEMGSSTRTLSRDYTPIASLTELKEYFEFYGQFTHTLLGEYTDLLLTRAEAIKPELDEAVVTDVESIIKIAKLLLIPKNPLKTAIGKSAYKLTDSDIANDERYDSTSSYKNPIGLNLFQSKYFVTDHLTDRDISNFLDKEHYDDVEMNEKFRLATDVLELVTKPKTEIVMAYSASKKPKVPKKATAKPIAHYDIEEVADSILTICDSIEMNTSDDRLKEIEKTEDMIEKVTQKIANVVDQMDSKDVTTVVSWRLIAGLNNVFITMATKPQSQWINHVFAVSRAAINVCNKSLSLYG